MNVSYQKMHGTGNLILVVDQRNDDLAPPSAENIRHLGDAETGPGFDQLMWVSDSNDGSSIAAYRVFNSDGSEVEQCGNGVRCVAQYLADGQVSEFELQSPAGPIAARVLGNGEVAVSMGAPIFEPSRIPFTAVVEANAYDLAVGDQQLQIAAVSMGNPHAVIAVDDVRAAAVNELGPKIERHERFPEGANVGFAHIRDRQNIDLRVHERGVGETAACGTGACAAVVAGQRRGQLDEEVAVNLPGGQVVISWRGDETPVWLRGNAVLITDGNMDLNVTRDLKE